MSTTYFTTMQEVAEWLETRMSDGDSEFVMAALADILRQYTSPTPKEKQLILELFTNVANS